MMILPSSCSGSCKVGFSAMPSWCIYITDNSIHKLVICSHRHFCEATLKRHVSAAMHVRTSNRASEMHYKWVWFRWNQYSVDTFTCSTCSCILQIHLSHANIHWWRSHEPPIHGTCNVHVQLVAFIYIASKVWTTADIRRCESIINKIYGDTDISRHFSFSFYHSFLEGKESNVVFFALYKFQTTWMR